jgi:hypothetical protein
MPVQATPVEVSNSYQNWVVTPDDVRMFMRDYPNMNILLADREFSDEEILRAFKMAISQANIIARPTDYTETNFPNAYTLQLGVAAYLMRTESFRQLRNQAQFQDGNIQPVGIDTKHSEYLQHSSQLSQEFQQNMTLIKVNENMNTFGMFRSPNAQTAYIR